MADHCPQDQLALQAVLAHANVSVSELLETSIKSLEVSDCSQWPAAKFTALIQLLRAAYHKEDLEVVVTKLMTKVVQPLLSHHQQPRCALQLLELCWPLTARTARQAVEDIVTQELTEYTSHSDSSPQMAATVDVLYVILRLHNQHLKPEELRSQWLDHLVTIILKILTSEEDTLSGKVLGLLLPQVLRLATTKQSHYLQQAWLIAQDLYEKFGCKTYSTTRCGLSQRPLLILCSLSDFFLPVAGAHPPCGLLQEAHFWAVLQSGFFYMDGLSRKRAMYLLKRLLDVIESCGEPVSSVVGDEGCPVFWWKKEAADVLAPMWHDFILFMETLEEKQVHVIKPLFPRFQNLIKATSTKIKDWPLLHTSWLTTVVQRVAIHESTFIKRWGIHALLAVDMTSCPLLDQGGQQFVCGPLISIMAESHVYYRGQEDAFGECPPGGVLVAKFLQSCFTSLEGPQRVEFFTAFLHGVRHQSWGGAALVYMTRALSELPSAPLWGTDSLMDIRELLSSKVRTLSGLCRGAAQCFMVKAVCKLMRWDQVGPEHLCGLLGTLSRAESGQRGSVLWSGLVERLSSLGGNKLWEPSHVTKTVEDLVKTWLTGTKLPEEGSCIDDDSLPLVRLFLVTLEAGLLQRPVDQPHVTAMEATLAPVLVVLTSINRNAYLPAAKADRALQFFSTIANEVQGIKGFKDDSVTAEVKKFCQLCLPDILRYIQRRLAEDMSQLSDVVIAQRYSECLSELADLDPCLFFQCPAWPTLLAQCLQQLEKSQAESTEAALVMRYGNMVILGKLIPSSHQMPPEMADQLAQFFLNWDCTTAFRKTQFHGQNQSDSGNPSSTSSVEWGRMSCAYLSAQWWCIHHGLQTGHQVPDSSPYLDACTSALDMVSGVFTAPMFRVLKLLFGEGHFKETSSQFASVCSMAWQKVLESKHNTHFYVACEEYIDIVFQDHVMAMTRSPDNSHIYEPLLKAFNAIVSMADDRGGMMNLLAKRLCGFFACEVDSWPDHSSQDLLVSIFCDILTYGPLHNKGFRFTADTISYITSLGSTCSVNQLLSVENSDACVRARALSLLTRLCTDKESHRRFARDVLLHLLERHQNMFHTKGYRTFGNSLSHRQKHRIVSAIVILHDRVNSEYRQPVVDHLFNVLLVENQTSVRILAEWLLIRYALIDAAVIDQIWTEMNKTSDKRAASMCSLLIVISHLGKLIQPLERKTTFLLTSLPRILPLGMVYHQNLRTFAQACLMTLWEEAQCCHLQNVLDQLAVLGEFVAFRKKHKDAGKSCERLLQTFWFTYHPLEDYNLKVMLHTMPRLASLSDDEWITPECFRAVDDSWCSSPNCHQMALEGNTCHLDCLEPGTWRLKAIGGSPDELQEGNVQKKLQPWRTMLPEAELEYDLQEEYSKKRQGAGKLIVVASLIDKIPNLGGLCRTSEIFGAAEYVIACVKYLDDEKFSSLSVTSHKWLPIKEVKPMLLKSYLLEMRAEGYTLVGAEQTADSVHLHQYNFPEKTLLLLGNEKEGIPVDLIQLLDVCVEIPQQGIIRSLNVHVSGALLVWEYARQHLLTAS